MGGGGNGKTFRPKRTSHVCFLTPPGFFSPLKNACDAEGRQKEAPPCSVVFFGSGGQKGNLFFTSPDSELGPGQGTGWLGGWVVGWLVGWLVGQRGGSIPRIPSITGVARTRAAY